MADVMEELIRLRDAVRAIEDSRTTPEVAAHATNALGELLLAILSELRDLNGKRNAGI